MALRFLQRSFHTSCQRSLPRLPRRANPGVGYQVQELGEAAPIESDAEGFGDIESDFMSVHRTHRQYEADVQRQRDRVREFMIKHKYFRDAQLPNLLTYAEKEQIRLLHSRDSEEWTIERLAESFPATPSVIDKILNAKWRARSTKRIRAHDEAVIRNWELLRSGKCETPIPPDLLEHLKKFADRNLTDLNISAEKWPTRPELPKPSGNEFSSIITSCSKYAEKEPKEIQKKLTSGKENQKELPPPSPDEDETYLLEKVKDKRKMRLQELKQLKLTPNDLNDDNLEQVALETLKNPSGTGRLPSTTKAAAAAEKHFLSNFADKFESSEIIISVEDQKRYEMTKIKDRIRIPRKVWKKGATFRVEDAYYDDDGEFLYRVPGMTGKFD